MPPQSRTRPALVLVHGGAHTHRCWQPTVDVLQRTDPGLRVLALDLPGREDVPGDLATQTIASGVTSLVGQIERAGVDRVVLVGHSLAGITVPGVATILGRDRVVRMIMVACCVPAQGQAVVDTLSGPLRTLARRGAKKAATSAPLPRPLANVFFCNGMGTAQKALVHAQLCGEASGVTIEPVDRRTLPAEIPRTWVRPLRDRALRRKQQLGFIENLGGVTDVVEIDACHDVMISHPAELARVLADRSG